MRVDSIEGYTHPPMVRSYKIVQYILHWLLSASHRIVFFSQFFFSKLVVGSHSSRKQWLDRILQECHFESWIIWSLDRLLQQTPDGYHRNTRVVQKHQEANWDHCHRCMLRPAIVQHSTKTKSAIALPWSPHNYVCVLINIRNVSCSLTLRKEISDSCLSVVN